MPLVQTLRILMLDGFCSTPNHAQHASRLPAGSGAAIMLSAVVELPFASVAAHLAMTVASAACWMTTPGMGKYTLLHGCVALKEALKFAIGSGRKFGHHQETRIQWI
mmetsp:Transcript_54047/g.99836  ORF Transcript_54047/g.99836 Transcript_54047/m.99836 type:complete len:107 (+) Transcript_54047:409-729(+)